VGRASAIVLFVGTKKSSLILVRWETRRRVDVAEHYLQVFSGRCALASLYLLGYARARSAGNKFQNNRFLTYINQPSLLLIMIVLPGQRAEER
jgi:hypothetical protein